MGELLRQFGVDWHLLLAQLLNFVLLLIVLRWLAYKPLVALLNRRRETIAQAMRDASEAATAKTDAKSLANSLEREARLKAQAILAEATANAEQQHQQILTQAKARALAVVTEAKAQLRVEQKAAVVEAQEQLAGLVVAATRQVWGALAPVVQQKAAAQAVAEAMAVIANNEDD
jgi:F-type H+-transporting ATPase subunit b